MKQDFELPRIGILSALILSTFSAGCGDRSGLAAIEGRVKFKNGEAIDGGTIEFARIDSKAADQSGARIANSDYEIPREKGLRPGKYVVRVYAPAFLLSGGEASGPPGARPPGNVKQSSQLPEERVSEAYNTQSKLSVEVTSDALQTFDFEVE